MRQHNLAERFRLRQYSDESDGNNGVFLVPFETVGLRIIASDGVGWEHVSVSLPNRCPNWREMCFVKGLFWDDEETVMQLHPPRSTYVNNHPHCLHLWRPTEVQIPLPPTDTVGIVGATAEDIQKLGLGYF